mgnify:CR=1 FL=1
MSGTLPLLKDPIAEARRHGSRWECAAPLSRALPTDGIGGGSPQTSKVAIVSPSLHPEADVDYLFVQVMVSQRRVDTAPNCGNMLCAVGPFAIDMYLPALPAIGEDLAPLRVGLVHGRMRSAGMPPALSP